MDFFRLCEIIRSVHIIQAGVKSFSMLSPCPGCGVLFPHFEGPTHAYVGASAGCWALLHWTVTTGGPDTTGLVAQSRIPGNIVQIPARSDTPPLDARRLAPLSAGVRPMV